MLIIDADAHVIESEATWRHLNRRFYARRPVPVTLPEDTSFGAWNGFWFIDEKLVHFGATPTTGKLARHKTYAIPSQEISDVGARLADLDRQRIEKQVLHPSLHLHNTALDPDLEGALMQSYNTFLSEKWAESGGRLTFAMLAPFRRPEAAVAEIRRVVGLGGAVSVFMRGIEWDHPLSFPGFHPIYAEAARHNLAVAVHLGTGSPTMNRMFDGQPRIPGEDPFFTPRGKRLMTSLSVQFAFYSLMESTLPEDFPTLRWAFLEGGGSAWVVPAVTALGRGARKNVRRILDDGRVYFGCEPDEDFTYIADKIGDACLVVASDMPHFDESAHESLAHEYESRDDVRPAILEKMFRTNAERLYDFDKLASVAPRAKAAAGR
jgi:predicted TIM-barrel fold metal-dependent hydrolase